MVDSPTQITLTWPAAPSNSKLNLVGSQALKPGCSRAFVPAWKDWLPLDKRHIFVRNLLLTMVLLGGLAWALPKPGQQYQVRQADLNGDGKKEKLALSAYRIIPQAESYWGRLQVFDSRGQLVWQAPQASEPGQPFAFGIWPYGDSSLDWLGDLDGDGHPELLSRAPQSDVRPATFRLYRWTGKAFEALPARMLLETAPGEFTWSEPREWDGQTPITWVMSLEGSAARPKASIYAYRENGQGAFGEARMAATANGLRVEAWTKKLAPLP